MLRLLRNIHLRSNSREHGCIRRQEGPNGFYLIIVGLSRRLSGETGSKGRRRTCAATSLAPPSRNKEFRCAFDLLAAILSATDPRISVKDQFFTFNSEHAFDDRMHIIARDLNVVHGPRFGMSMWDGLALARVSLTPEAMLDGRRIEEFFSPRFF
jgi:hypothetical protein